MNLPYSGQPYDLLFVFMGVMLIDLTPFRVGMLFSEQVKLSTKKVRQNKQKNKKSDF